MWRVGLSLRGQRLLGSSVMAREIIYYHARRTEDVLSLDICMADGLLGSHTDAAPAVA